jgi:hypothetical protein
MYRHAGELVDKILGGTKHDVGQSSRGRTSLEESPSLLQGLSIVLDGHGSLAGRLRSMRACVCQERRHCPAPGEARDCGGASFRLESLITVVQLQAKTANTTDALAANDSIPTNGPRGQVRCEASSAYPRAVAAGSYELCASWKTASSIFSALWSLGTQTGTPARCVGHRPPSQPTIWPIQSHSKGEFAA